MNLSKDDLIKLALKTKLKREYFSKMSKNDIIKFLTGVEVENCSKRRVQEANKLLVKCYGRIQQQTPPQKQPPVQQMILPPQSPPNIEPRMAPRIATITEECDDTETRIRDLYNQMTERLNSVRSEVSATISDALNAVRSRIEARIEAQQAQLEAQQARIEAQLEALDNQISEKTFESEQRLSRTLKMQLQDGISNTLVEKVNELDSLIESEISEARNSTNQRLETLTKLQENLQKTLTKDILDVKESFRDVSDSVNVISESVQYNTEKYLELESKMNDDFSKLDDDLNARSKATTERYSTLLDSIALQNEDVSKLKIFVSEIDQEMQDSLRNIYDNIRNLENSIAENVRERSRNTGETLQSVRENVQNLESRLERLISVGNDRAQILESNTLELGKQQLQLETQANRIISQNNQIVALNENFSNLLNDSLSELDRNLRTSQVQSQDELRNQMVNLFQTSLDSVDSRINNRIDVQIGRIDLALVDNSQIIATLSLNIQDFNDRLNERITETERNVQEHSTDLVTLDNTLQSQRELLSSLENNGDRNTLAIGGIVTDVAGLRQQSDELELRLISRIVGLNETQFVPRFNNVQERLNALENRQLLAIASAEEQLTMQQQVELQSRVIQSNVETNLETLIQSYTNNAIQQFQENAIQRLEERQTNIARLQQMQLANFSQNITSQLNRQIREFGSVLQSRVEQTLDELSDSAASELQQEYSVEFPERLSIESSPLESPSESSPLESSIREVVEESVQESVQESIQNILPEAVNDAVSEAVAEAVVEAVPRRKRRINFTGEDLYEPILRRSPRKRRVIRE